MNTMTYNRIFALMVALVLLVPPAFAGSSECDTNAAPDGDAGICAFYLIEQGETDYYSTYVPSGSSTLFVNLNWFIPQQSLTLTIISPSGSTYASYHDSDLDGYDNAIIRAWISSPEAGTWQFQVYGEKVRETQDYTFGTTVS
ncbi:MAG: PPC domain-containing protein [Methanoculleus sp.]|nr:PPC domain-containing protein [Methanoculleus sp. UBA377]MDD2472476.1 PPC domain-containing protein [Methanoculleus sp.]